MFSFCMIIELLVVLLLFAASSDVTNAQNASITYLDTYTPLWTATTSPVVNIGNGVFLSPDGMMAVVVSSDTTVTAYSITDGVQVWTYKSPVAGSATNGGVFFCYTAAVPYIVFSSYSSASISSIVALSPTDGSTILTLGDVAGIVAGTPVTTEDGQYILATINNNGTGIFNVYNIASPSAPQLSYTYSDPFSAIGYYYNPSEGNFPGGETNTNDVFIWSAATDTSAANISVGLSQFFGFQLPLPTNSASTTLNVTLITGDRDYQASTAPVITDDGLSMYWSVSRSKVYGWVGTGEGRYDFTTNGVGSVQVSRDLSRPWASADTTPTLSNSPDGFVVGTGATAQIFRIDRNFTTTEIIVTSATIVTSSLIVSPDDTFVYYATVNPDNSLYRVSSADLSPSTSFKLSAPVIGEMAQSLNGALVIIADSAGGVQALTVATADDVTVPPSETPSSSPIFLDISTEPSSAPSHMGSAAPTNDNYIFMKITVNGVVEIQYNNLTFSNNSASLTDNEIMLLEEYTEQWFNDFYNNRSIDISDAFPSSGSRFLSHKNHNYYNSLSDHHLRQLQSNAASPTSTAVISIRDMATTITVQSYSDSNSKDIVVLYKQSVEVYYVLINNGTVTTLEAFLMNDNATTNENQLALFLAIYPFRYIADVEEYRTILKINILPTFQYVATIEQPTVLDEPQSFSAPSFAPITSTTSPVYISSERTVSPENVSVKSGLSIGAVIGIVAAFVVGISMAYAIGKRKSGSDAITPQSSVPIDPSVPPIQQEVPIVVPNDARRRVDPPTEADQYAVQYKDQSRSVVGPPATSLIEAVAIPNNQTITLLNDAPIATAVQVNKRVPTRVASARLEAK